MALTRHPCGAAGGTRRCRPPPLRDVCDGSKRPRHPQIGDLDLRYETFTVNTPDQQPVVYQASPSSSADDAFNRAAS
ncbi:hypothetical protein OG871_05500 [Kitasatospora sp. NBC_00374]